LIALAGAAAAVSATALADSVVEEALDCLCEQNHSAGMRQAVEATVEWRDTQARDLKAAGDVDDRAEYRAAFQRARAAAAVMWCFEREPLLEVNETLYEASLAVGGDVRLRAVIEAVLAFLGPWPEWDARELASLYFPRFIEVDGYVLLADHYDPDNLASWVEVFPDRPAELLWWFGGAAAARVRGRSRPQQPARG
jgi:hypothetical protein